MVCPVRHHAVADLSTTSFIDTGTFTDKIAAILCVVDLRYLLPQNFRYSGFFCEIRSMQL